jgi:processive rubber oxygenase RoxA-like protein
MRTSLKVILLSSALAAAFSAALAQSPSTPLQYAKQGWTADERQAFYTTSQGSHMVPYAWYKALRRLDVDQPFGGDQLQRYGYLPNEKSKLNPEGLPVGFVIDGDAATGHLGMTCAACHTAEIEYRKDGAAQRLRLDGAPATANFQLFLTDLSTASRATLSDPDRLSRFAHDALGPRYSATRVNALKKAFGDWVKQFGDFMDKSLPTSSPWGPARLDAFGMIFNRAAGQDLNIPANIQVADAPVSYPFLWNASRQDKTQWNGGVPNGLYINALGRNTGEVFGVFADFSPKRTTNTTPPLIDYRNNSVRYDGLQALEEKIATLKPPPWPFDLDDNLVNQGRGLFARHCGSCHEERRLPQGTWYTPVTAVGTDEKMFKNSLRQSDAGLLAGALSPNPPGSTLANPAATVDILAATVLGAQLAAAFPIPPKLPDFNHGVWRAISLDLTDLLGEGHKAPSVTMLLSQKTRDDLKAHIRDRLANIFRPPAPDAPAAYEARVLHGVWATAPYLHNGSVPNLWELLLPPERRSPSFMVGSRKFDPKNVGYVTTESPYKDGMLVVGSGAAPGNSNAGHDYGREMNDDQRKALLEYLKQL